MRVFKEMFSHVKYEQVAQSVKADSAKSMALPSAAALFTVS